MVTEREVHEVFTLTDKASGPLKNMAQQMGMMQGHAGRAQGAIDRLLVPALGFFGVGLGLKSFVHKLYEVHEAADEVTDTITAAWIASDRFAHAGAVDNLAASMKRGQQAFEAIEDMATRGVAPMKVYAGVYKALALPALERTKISQKELLKFTEDLVPVLGAVTGNVQMAAHQAKMFGNILATGTGRPPKELLKVVGMTGKEFDKLRKKGVEPMFAEMQKRIKENAPAFKTLFEDPGVQFGRLRATADQLFRILGAPVMEKLNEKAQELLKYVRENKQEVFAIAREWGEKVAVGFEHVLDIAKFLKDNIKLIAVGIAGIKFAPSIMSGFQMLSKFAGGGAGGSKAVFSLYERFVMLADNVLPAFGSRLGEATGSLVQMIGKGPLVVAGLTALYVGLQAAADYFEEFHKKRVVETGEREARFGGTKGHLFQLATGKFGRDPSNVIKEMARMGLVSKQGDLKSAQYAEQLTGITEAQRTLVKRSIDAIVSAWSPEDIAKLAFPSAKEIAEQAKGKPPQINFNNNSFSIKQAFAEGFDPDRIAVAFTQDLVQLGERKLMSGLSLMGAMR